jgi:hypothetical protein
MSVFSDATVKRAQGGYDGKTNALYFARMQRMPTCEAVAENAGKVATHKMLSVVLLKACGNSGDEFSRMRLPRQLVLESVWWTCSWIAEPESHACVNNKLEIHEITARRVVANAHLSRLYVDLYNDVIVVRVANRQRGKH